MHLFVWDIFLRVLASVAIVLLGIALYSLVPTFLQFLFRRVTRIEKDYRHVFREYRSGDAYVEASYWRTNFFLCVYFVVKATAVISTLFLLGWIWHVDFGYLLTGLGIYGLVITFHASDYVRNTVAHIWIISSDILKAGMHVEISGVRGVIIDITSMHVVLCDPELLKRASSAQLSQLYEQATIKQHSNIVPIPIPVPAQGARTSATPSVTTSAAFEGTEGISFVPSGNVISSMIRTTNVGHFYPYLQEVVTHRD